MTDLLLWTSVFVASLFVLIKASDYFTMAAEKIGLYFGIPAFIVGVTIVALGTSLPELVSSVIAVMKGSSEIVVGNVVGSNIANIFLVLGISAIIGKKMKISYELVHVDLPLLMGSAFLIALMCWDGIFTWVEGLLCLMGLALYLTYTVFTVKEEQGFFKALIGKLGSLKKNTLGWQTIAFLIGSSLFVFLGAKYTVESIINLAEILNMGTEIIAVTAVAIGTSLPELMVSISAAKKGNPEMAVGNVLGSNIFNSFAVMGIPSFIGVLVIPESIITFSIPVMLIATILYFFMTQDKEITRWEGWLLVIFYAFFVGELFSLI